MDGWVVKKTKEKGIGEELNKTEFDKRFPGRHPQSDEHRAPTNFFRHDIGPDFDALIEAQTYEISVRNWIAQRTTSKVETVLQTRRFGPMYAEVDGVVQLDNPLKLVEGKLRRKQLLQFKSGLDLGIRPPFWGMPFLRAHGSDRRN
jgi:hypothetical protein